MITNYKGPNMSKGKKYRKSMRSRFKSTSNYSFEVHKRHKNNLSLARMYGHNHNPNQNSNQSQNQSINSKKKDIIIDLDTNSSNSRRSFDTIAEHVFGRQHCIDPKTAVECLERINQKSTFYDDKNVKKRDLKMIQKDVENQVLEGTRKQMEEELKPLEGFSELYKTKNPQQKDNIIKEIEPEQKDHDNPKASKKRKDLLRDKVLKKTDVINHKRLIRNLLFPESKNTNCQKDSAPKEARKKVSSEAFLKRHSMTFAKKSPQTNDFSFNSHLSSEQIPIYAYHRVSDDKLDKIDVTKGTITQINCLKINSSGTQIAYFSWIRNEPPYERIDLYMPAIELVQFDSKQLALYMLSLTVLKEDDHQNSDQRNKTSKVKNKQNGDPKHIKED